jgi:hypothetical protein
VSIWACQYLTTRRAKEVEEFQQRLEYLDANTCSTGLRSWRDGFTGALIGCDAVGLLHPPTLQVPPTTCKDLLSSHSIHAIKTKVNKLSISGFSQN